MKPRRDRSTEGRVNPKGIPCLYCSDRRDTAMTETRPWIGAYVTVAQLELARELTIIDCSLDIKAPSLPLIRPNFDAEKELWWAIDGAFSEPVTASDDKADYSPTQKIAELFKISSVRLTRDTPTATN